MKKIISIIFIFILSLVLGGCKPVDYNIKVYTRDTTSGTRDGFFTVIGFSSAVKSNADLVEGHIEVESNGAMITFLKNDEYGIGYISLSSLKDSGLTGLNYEGVAPTVANVNDNTYKLTRNFNYVITTDNTIEGDLVRALVAYMGTKEGKATIQGADGIVEIKSADPSWADIKANHPVVDQNNENITINFGGSTSVEKVAKALSSDFRTQAGNFVAVHNHTGSGDAYKNVQGSESTGANKLHIGFASREFKSDGTEDNAPGSFGIICKDAIVVVVNNQNQTLTNITSAQLVGIYKGTIVKWSEME